MFDTFGQPPATRRRACLALLGGACLGLAAAARGQQAPPPLRFGILPIGGTLDSRTGWEPVLAELAQHVGRHVSLLSATSYEALNDAVAKQEVDVAFLSGRMALDAVTRRNMRVIAQVSRHDGLPGYRATLLALQGGPVPDLQAVLAAPGKWRLARGEKRSMSGFIVPKLELFLPRQIDIETAFLGEIVGTHQRTALAVANREADLATNNSADFERFALQFPAEAGRLRVLWQSELIPHGAIVIHRQHDATLRAPVQRFLVGYGRGEGERAERQRAVLKGLHDFAGFLPSDNRSLLPVASLAHKLALDSASAAQWIDDAARQARLARIESDYAAQLRVLNTD
ncbi:MAG: phosphate/phosphite/phosphonate ABC transporter substrate-binding protein [Pseudomonadota bacterium]|nr:phosphate/phosphite/phosphonate ABC transporter substrate-binding protein [Pseudomonadota bacterium]